MHIITAVDEFVGLLCNLGHAGGAQATNTNAQPILPTQICFPALVPLVSLSFSQQARSMEAQ